MEAGEKRADGILQEQRKSECAGQWEWIVR